MLYRVYDNRRKKWITNNVYLTQEGLLFELKKSVFGKDQLQHMSQDRYTYQKSIELYDKNDVLIYIGDYIKAEVPINEDGAETEIVTGVVNYAPEFSAYIIFRYDIDKWYTLGEHVSSNIEVVGNVFEGIQEDKYNDEQALQS